MNDSDLPLPPARTLTRSLDDRIIAGVAGGLARHFDMDPTIIRVIFGFLLVPGGLPGFLPYLILWAVMPDDAGQRQSLPLVILFVFLGLPALCVLCWLSAMVLGVGGAAMGGMMGR